MDRFENIPSEQIQFMQRINSRGLLDDINEEPTQEQTELLDKNRLGDTKGEQDSDFRAHIIFDYAGIYPSKQAALALALHSYLENNYGEVSVIQKQTTSSKPTAAVLGSRGSATQFGQRFVVGFRYDKSAVNFMESAGNTALTIKLGNEDVPLYPRLSTAFKFYFEEAKSIKKKQQQQQQRLRKLREQQQRLKRAKQQQQRRKAKEEKQRLRREQENNRFRDNRYNNRKEDSRRNLNRRITRSRSGSSQRSNNYRNRSKVKNNNKHQSTPQKTKYKNTVVKQWLHQNQKTQPQDQKI